MGMLTLLNPASNLTSSLQHIMMWIMVLGLLLCVVLYRYRNTLLFRSMKKVKPGAFKNSPMNSQLQSASKISSPRSLFKNKYV